MKENNIKLFDVVSIQFAIHYFFETSKIFETFFKNINKYVKKRRDCNGNIFRWRCSEKFTRKK